MIRCKNVLVATDFSESSDTAFLYGRELARLLDAQLHVIHVVSDIVATGMLPATYVPELGTAQRELERDAQTQLEAMVRNDDGRGRAPIVVVRTAANAAAEILAYINDQPIDLVVVGSHGHTAIAHLLLGSVADKVVRAAPCPVLTVRHPERDFIHPDALQTTARMRM